MSSKSLSAERHIPGEPGLWVFILGDMTVFALLFGAFLYERSRAPELFEESRRHLTLAFGAVNTLVLLTSSVLVALAVQAQRAHQSRTAGRLVVAAGVCAATFVALKAVEWTELLSAGNDPSQNLFFTYYFALTGLHLLHLLLGCGALGLLAVVTRRAQPRPRDRLVLEAGASYWHMVDLLWVVIFPLVYLAST